MKKLITSVISGLFIGLIYLIIALIVTCPLILLTRMGYLLGDAQTVVGQILGEALVQISDLGPVSIILIILQIVLYIACCLVTFIFISKAMNVLLHNRDEGYFRNLYKIFFLFIMIIPELITMAAVFIPLVSIKFILITDVSLAMIVFAFAFIISSKILPDLKESQGKQFFSGDINE